MRALLETGEADHGGARVRMGWPGPQRIPIIISAHGPRSLRLAGRFGDGVIVGLGVTPEVVAGSLALIEEGARESGRPRRPRGLVHVLLVRRRRARGRRRPRRVGVHLVRLHFARAGAEGKWVPDELLEGVLELGRAYDFEVHGAVPPAKQAGVRRLAERLGVLDYLRRRFVFCGTPDEVESQIRTAIDAGASNFDGAIDAQLPEHEERITALAGWCSRASHPINNSEAG